MAGGDTNGVFPESDFPCRHTVFHLLLSCNCIACLGKVDAIYAQLLDDYMIL
jgi:hypothetical protein